MKRGILLIYLLPYLIILSTIPITTLIHFTTPDKDKYLYFLKYKKTHVHGWDILCSSISCSLPGNIQLVLSELTCAKAIPLSDEY